MNLQSSLYKRTYPFLFIAWIDGLTGFADAIAATYLNPLVQLCMVHVVRNSVTDVSYVSYKHRNDVWADLKLQFL
ncbi:MAG: transposase [Synechococcales cyanobacterium M58_A2018_015]|nr:transposase [Synechococcales cyanobacterium M58_A2018_015]